MEYEKGEINFKGLVFSWSLITTENLKHGEVEVFNIEVYNPKTEKKIRQEFKNSVMENTISKGIKDYKNIYPFSQLREIIRPKSWAGYDENLKGTKLKSFSELVKKRVWWLMLGVIVDFAGFINFKEECPSFKDFCNNFGFEQDSREAERIYKNCLEYCEKIESLSLNEEQINYFLEEARQETDKFTEEDLKKAIE